MKGWWSFSNLAAYPTGYAALRFKRGPPDLGEPAGVKWVKWVKSVFLHCAAMEEPTCEIEFRTQLVSPVC